jgi:SSS family transporter
MNARHRTRPFLWLVAAIVMALTALPARSQPVAPSQPVPLGAAVGTLDGRVVVIGGTDESGVATAAIRLDGAADPAALDSPVAYAAAVQADDGVIVIGGLDGSGKPVASVTRLVLAGGRIVVSPLPPLPVSIAGAGAARLGNDVYVVGGWTGAADPAAAASNRVFVLDLSSPGSWRELPALPTAGRVGAAVTSSFGMVHVFGGRVAEPAAGGVAWRLTGESWTYRPRPVDGTTSTGWRSAAPLPKPHARAAAFQPGQSHSVVFGGDRGPVAADPLGRDSPAGPPAPAAAYHAVTDTWTPVPLGGDPGVVAPAVVRLDGKWTAVGGAGTSGRASAARFTLDLPKPTGSLRWPDYAAIVAYFVGMAGIGVYFARREKSSDEFSLGNRNVKWWAGAISMYATGVSSISLMAIPVLGFTSNLVFLIPVFLMLPQAVIQATYIVPLLRKLEITSTYEYLERRFNLPLRLLASGQCISLQALGRTSVVLLLPSLALSATTGLDVYVSIVLMGVLTTVYTAVGGFEAVIWTDVAQGVIMLLGPLLMIVYALSGTGSGPSEWMAVATHYEKFTPVLLTWDFTVYAAWIAVLASILTVAGFAGDQPIVQRVYATPLKDVKRLQYMFAFLGVFVAVLVTAVGTSLFLYYQANPGRLALTMSNDQLVPRFVIDVLPTGVAGVIIAAIFAAAMSTMSSSMNSVSVLVSEDFYRRFVKDADDRRRLRLMKRISYLVGAIGTALAIVMATWEIRSIFETWNRIAALLGGGFVGVYALGIFTRRANGVGAFAGAVASVAWTLYAQTTPMHWTLLAPSATVACIVLGYVVSLLVPGPSRDLTGLTIFTTRRATEPARDEVMQPA